eukprot:TRINITY_DN7012_c0_g4_i2.p1 TRINITY_DN7012_c0_g4~~TRINITY_DN7012_c0_g4_i2.p1  ORF type:complete len:271 (-),score=17.85 TRINITY_DN7012_c0_g4_i2:175-987(-)
MSSGRGMTTRSRARAKKATLSTGSAKPPISKKKKATVTKTKVAKKTAAFTPTQSTRSPRSRLVIRKPAQPTDHQSQPADLPTTQQPTAQQSQPTALVVTVPQPTTLAMPHTNLPLVQPLSPIESSQNRTFMDLHNDTTHPPIVLPEHSTIKSKKSNRKETIVICSEDEEDDNFYLVISSNVESKTKLCIVDNEIYSNTKKTLNDKCPITSQPLTCEEGYSSFLTCNHLYSKEGALYMRGLYYSTRARNKVLECAVFGCAGIVQSNNPVFP